MPKLALVTPIHNPFLTQIEVQRLNKSLSLNQDYHHFFVYPKSMKFYNIIKLFPNSNFKFFDKGFFTSKSAYNNLMLSQEFYEYFLDYEYILIHQTDAFLIKNLKPILEKDFTYLGASWNPAFVISNIYGHLFVNRNVPFASQKTYLTSGNGGLSLRKTSTILDAIVFFKSNNLFFKQIFKNRRIAEDILLVFMLNLIGYSIISKKEADRYFIESAKIDFLTAKEKFGFHALEKFQPNLEKQLLANL